MKIQNGRVFGHGHKAAATMSCGGVAAVSPPSHPFLRWCAETPAKQLVISRPGAPLLQCRTRQNVLPGYGQGNPSAKLFSCLLPACRTCPAVSVRRRIRQPNSSSAPWCLRESNLRPPAAAPPRPLLPPAKKPPSPVRRIVCDLLLVPRTGLLCLHNQPKEADRGPLIVKAPSGLVRSPPATSGETNGRVRGAGQGTFRRI